MKMCDVKEKPVCVGVIMGIPGSGKSYFSRFLQDYFTKNSDSVLKSVCVLCVCYDRFVKYKNCYLSSEKWKDQRKRVFLSVENLIYALKNLEYFDKCTLVTNMEKENVFKSECVLVLIDDNMYYRSMRYEYYQLARKFSVSFCQFYLKTDLKDALKFNKMREICNTVPEETVQKMLAKFEAPDMKNSWERLSLVINSHGDFSKVISSIRNIIIESLNNPVDGANGDKKMKCKEHTSNSNVIHQFDIALRHWIERHMKQMAAQGAKSDQLKLLGQMYSNKKKQILQDMKAGILTVPCHIDIFSECKSGEELDKFIEVIFQN